MVSVASHLRAVARPLAVASTVVLFFVFLSSSYNLSSSYRSEESASDLFSIGKTSRAPGAGNATPKIGEIKAASEISQLTTAVARRSSDVGKKSAELCPLVSPKLVGWTNITSEMEEALLKEDHVKVESKMKEAGLEIGGRYEPSECRSRHKVAIVVPYRDREDHLTVFLRYLHPFLMRQQLNYVVLIVEQSAGSPFNRGMLMNIGFNEAQSQETFECFIFHDVDFLPEDDSNPYTCPQDGSPRQMSFSIDYWDNYKPTPRSHFGGVTALSAADFRRINGYSNSFWGWGGEDDQLYQRVRFNNLTVVRAFDDQPSLVHKARYKTQSHRKAQPNPERKQVLAEGNVRFKTDGLFDLKYERLDLRFQPLYTHILVDIQQRLIKS